MTNNQLGSWMGCVYRAYDADGVLLYIGQSMDFEARRREHMKNSMWRGQVARWRARWYGHYLTTWAVEKAAIRTEHPRWNVTHRALDHPDGFVKTLAEVIAMYPDDVMAPESLCLQSMFTRRMSRALRVVA